MRIPTPTKLPRMVCSKRRSWSGQMICVYSSSKRFESSSNAPSPNSRMMTSSGNAGPAAFAASKSRMTSRYCGSAIAVRSIAASDSFARFAAFTRTAAFSGSASPAKFSRNVGVVARTRTASIPPEISGSQPPAEMCASAACSSAAVNMPREMPSSASFQSSAKASLNSGSGFDGSKRLAYSERRRQSSRGAYCARSMMRLLTSSSCAS